MTDIPIIARNILAKHFGDDHRMISAFEDMNAGAAEAQTAVTANVDATAALQDATVIVLSANDVLTNERILKLAPGLDFVIDDIFVTIQLQDVARTENFAVTFIADGDSELIVPLVGTLVAFEKAGDHLGDYASDAAAATAGVQVGQLYHNTGVLHVRLV